MSLSSKVHASFDAIEDFPDLFIDYCRIDEQLSIDGMLQDRTRGSARYHTASFRFVGKSKVLLSNRYARIHGALPRAVSGSPPWAWKKIALLIRSNTAFLDSIQAYIFTLPVPCSAHFLRWHDKSLRPVFDALSASLEDTLPDPPHMRALGSDPLPLGSPTRHHCLAGAAGRPRVCCGSVAPAPCQPVLVASHPHHPRPPVRLVAAFVLRFPSLRPGPSHAAPLLDSGFRGLARRACLSDLLGAQTTNRRQPLKQLVMARAGLAKAQGTVSPCSSICLPPARTARGSSQSSSARCWCAGPRPNNADHVGKEGHEQLVGLHLSTRCLQRCVVRGSRVRASRDRPAPPLPPAVCAQSRLRRATHIRMAPNRTCAQRGGTG